MRIRLSNHNEVAHVWASQSQSEGKATNVFFKGDTIYSYGLHFPMARIVDGRVWYTSQSYSVSTAKHLSIVRSAVSHMQTITVQNVLAERPDEHQANIREMQQRLEGVLGKAKRARKYSKYYLKDAETIAADLALYMASTGESNLDALQLVASVKSGSGIKEVEKRIERQKTAERKREERRSREQAKLLHLALQSVEDWRKGIESAAWINSRHYLPYSALRLTPDGDVETTQGLTIPRREARKLFLAIAAGVDIVGRRISYYTVTSWDRETLVVGCHRIPASDVFNIGYSLVESKAS